MRMVEAIRVDTRFGERHIVRVEAEGQTLLLFGDYYKVLLMLKLLEETKKAIE